MQPRGGVTTAVQRPRRGCPVDSVSWARRSGCGRGRRLARVSCAPGLGRAGWATIVAGIAGASNDGHTNLVFLMPDQLRPDFLGCYGAGSSGRRTSIAGRARRPLRSRLLASPGLRARPRLAAARAARAAHRRARQPGYVPPDYRAPGSPPGRSCWPRAATTPPRSARCTSTPGTRASASAPPDRRGQALAARPRRLLALPARARPPQVPRARARGYLEHKGAIVSRLPSSSAGPLGRRGGRRFIREHGGTDRSR